MKKLVLTILLAFSLLTVQAATPKVIFEPYDAVRQAALAQIKDALSIYQDMNSVKFQEYRNVILDSLKTSIDLFSCAEFEQYPALLSAPVLRLITMPSELTTPHIFEWINASYSVNVATYTNGPAHGKGTEGFSGSTLLPNGKVMLTPRSSENIGIYDPATETYANGPAHGKGNYAYAFSGSTLMPNGKVMLTPYNSENIGIYDPATETYANGPEHGKGTKAFSGSTLMPNGKVMLTPYVSATIGIYDPATETYANGPTHGQGSFAFSGSTLMPNGKVMLVPFFSAKIGIYDPDITDLELRDWPLLSAYFNKF
jgi:hypothetical protein